MSHLQKHGRERWYTLIWEKAECQLQLKIKTIELTFRLCDTYCHKTDDVNSPFHFISGKRQGYTLFLQQSSILFGTILHLCAKYQEIYPPNIDDIMYYAMPRFTRRQQVLQQEKIVC